MLEMNDQREMLCTNGLGSYSLCAINGSSFRKYHGLLTIATKPPVNRLHLIGEFGLKIRGSNGLSQTLKPLTFEGVPYPIATEKWRFEQGDLLVERKRAFVQGQQYLSLSYTFEAQESLKLAIVPQYNVRDHHDTRSVDSADYGVGYQVETGSLKVIHPLATSEIRTSVPFVIGIKTGECTRYAIETERGYPDEEDHLEVGYYKVDILAGMKTEVTFILAYSDTDASEPQSFLEPNEVFAHAIAHFEKLRVLANEIPSPFEPLVYAANQFIALRSTTGKASILAGFPWFTDWGRDTMISIPGLCLATGRPELALEMIETFLAHAHEGIIPNNFPDQGEPPMYNTVDGTLWLFQAFYAYWLETKDRETLARLYPELKKIIGYHQRGTINGIFVDQDGLLSSGDATTQLTWMDVKVNGWVVTERHGKAVEINALYYNALRIMAVIAAELQDHRAVKEYDSQADHLKKSFHEVFWNEGKGYLNDLSPEGFDGDQALYAMIRPNMLFAISLPFPVLHQKHWPNIVNVCKEALYFDRGLRSLSPNDSLYQGLYLGDLLSRDGAYHRGTGWGWLLGPFLEAHLKTFNDKAWVEQALKSALVHLNEGALGTYAENFDGDAPHRPRGCCAQAWSVAEVLRIARLVYGTKG